jgi:hypothetical protein
VVVTAPGGHTLDCIWVQHKTPAATPDQRRLGAGGSMLVQLALVPFPHGTPKAAGLHGRVRRRFLTPEMPRGGCSGWVHAPAQPDPMEWSGPFRVPRGLWYRFDPADFPRHVLYNGPPPPRRGLPPCAPPSARTGAAPPGAGVGHSLGGRAGAGMPDPKTGALVVGDRAARWMVSGVPAAPGQRPSESRHYNRIIIYGEFV